ncbi:hypothetical protein FQN54_001400 [Arachnomyces sp. PD_36]|nr:hypothetical protein FQN54_001400 [Arachnomyces sp. PD_36]
MGRKPNQLILEFFIRGQKLEDSSNRYQHTCKACGEVFPKGRIDSLTNHLVKKCQAIPMRDRQSVLLRLHELPDLADGRVGDKDSAGGALSKGKTVNLPYSVKPAFDGLNVLAEASRQVGASDQGQGGQGQAQSQATAGGKTVVVDPALEAEGYHGLSHSELMVEHSDQQLGEMLSRINQASGPPGIPIQAAEASSSSPQLPNVTLPSDPIASARQSSQLSMIAASASEMVPHAGGLSTSNDGGNNNLNWSSRLFDGENSDAGTTQLSLEATSQDQLQQHPELTAATQRAASYPRPIAMNPNSNTKGFVNDFGNATKPTKPKVRGRFSATRRKEVKEVRKRGACMRCRMLKKPCSGESPCATCKGVESARLWKQPCIRTRVAEELDLYSAGLHATLSYHDVNSVKSQVQFERFPGHIEVTHFEGEPHSMTFSAVHGYRQHDANIDPHFQDLSHDNPLNTDPRELYLLDCDGAEFSRKLEQYMKQMAPVFYEHEPSSFMKPTLILAAELSVSKEDNLLQRVLELWTATHLLVDVEMHWKIFSVSNLHQTPTDEARKSINDAIDSESYALMCGQLRSATEKRAAQLSKLVMNDLERRLLQRQQSNWFETFLVAIILLNCVERASWLFRTWDNDHFSGRWPLDRRPTYYAEQGDRFSDILHMLLKMRGLPPKTSPRPDNSVLRAVEGSEEAACNWFETIGITTQVLEQCQVAGFDPNNSRSFELKYCAKILLPANCYT